MTDSNVKNTLDDDDFWATMGVNDTPKSKEVKAETTETTETTAPVAPVETVETVIAIAPIGEATPTVVSTVAPTDSSSFSSKKYSINDLPTIKMESSLPREYLEIVERIQIIYHSLPPMDHNAMRREAKDLAVASHPTPDAQSINALLEQIQGSKSRLEEILNDIILNYNFKKRALDVLRDTWSKFSTAKNADSRKAEANYIVANFEIDLANVESTFKACDHVYKSLESLHDGVSRRITIMQVCLKYADIGRGMAPDFSFKTFSAKINSDENQVDNTLDPSQGIDAVEQGFRVK